MKSELFIHAKNKLRRKTTKRIAKSKQSFKNAKTAIKQTIETIIFYNSEIKIQFARFKTNLKNINNQF